MKNLEDPNDSSKKDSISRSILIQSINESDQKNQVYYPYKNNNLTNESQYIDESVQKLKQEVLQEFNYQNTQNSQNN